MKNFLKWAMAFFSITFYCGCASTLQDSKSAARSTASAHEAKAIRCLKDICVGDLVQTPEGMFGDVREIFTDGRVVLQITSELFQEYQVEQLHP